ncbi:polysaccharide lyase family 14 protein [Polyporus arcularius HHB13444]|uniref:Polysaccharide lyase family 14 protein n=1 Tax=Polyporus arcularius HHB13444 TaxID=1314778 RepID=A0A5C3PEK1_9APHY|nr:polysaccharide lyase family 14 protein [Polyporus arcularius HHB13444]
MTDLSAFNIKNFAYGKNNVRLIVSDPPKEDKADSPTETLTEAAAGLLHGILHGLFPPSPEKTASPYLQLYYPANSINPGQEPQGGADFYATPLDLSRATNVSMEYSVFFPSDFDWVEGGKMPGIYGGHDGCSGGDDALDCFSTRLMWRGKGLGELYLYAPKDKQTAALCKTPPKSVCESDYGFSIARGAFSFAAGKWTHIRQTVVLNTPGKQDGGFALDVNGKRVIERSDILYRDDTSANTFFGGHEPKFATPKDQFSWFKDFSMTINP